jgi:hypothetical protein
VILKLAEGQVVLDLFGDLVHAVFDGDAFHVFFFGCCLADTPPDAHALTWPAGKMKRRRAVKLCAWLDGSSGLLFLDDLLDKFGELSRA